MPWVEQGAVVADFDNTSSNATITLVPPLAGAVGDYMLLFLNILSSTHTLSGLDDWTLLVTAQQGTDFRWVSHIYGRRRESGDSSPSVVISNTNITALVEGICWIAGYSNVDVDDPTGATGSSAPIQTVPRGPAIATAEAGQLYVCFSGGSQVSDTLAFTAPGTITERQNTSEKPTGASARLYVVQGDLVATGAVAQQDWTGDVYDRPGHTAVMLKSAGADHWAWAEQDQDSWHGD